MIDYKAWDFSGRGKNFLPLLSQKERAIWRAALLFQDKRDDPGQGEIVTNFTLLLLEQIHSAVREIAVPAAILHDTGWKKMKNPGKMHRDAVKAGIVDTVAYREVHQDKSVEVAQEILAQVRYPVKYRQPIYHIIADHDTRLKPTTLEGEVMRDADVLWRFTVPHRNAYFKDKTPVSLFAAMQLELKKPNRFYSQIAFKIAEEELWNTIAWCFPEAYTIMRSKN